MSIKKPNVNTPILNLELADLRAENERLQQELTKTRRKLTIYRTALANAKIRARDLEKQAINNMESWLIVSHKATALQQELKATEASWSNAELREAALRKRIAESPVVSIDRYSRQDWKDEEARKLNAIVNTIERFDNVKFRLVKDD